MFPYILVISILFLIVILLFYVKSNSIEKVEDVIKSEFTGKPCPICQWPLQKNERVHSVIYRTKGDSIMHIYGCPYCYKDHPKSRYKKDSIKTCPSCKKELKTNEFVIARLFEKPGKNHVHVLGCYRCRGKR